MAERCLELLNLDSNNNEILSLDIGSGSGLSGEVLQSNGLFWIGIDISPDMLNIALSRQSE